MAKKFNSQCKLCRRAGEKLFLKGDRCSSPKCAALRKPYAPGMHGQKSKRGLSEYGKQLAEKQKVKRVYGINERQLLRHLSEAKKQKGAAGENLLIRLEQRLDSVILAMGLAYSRAQARQLTSHGMFLINGRTIDVASAKIKTGDTIKVKEGKIKNTYFDQLREILKKKQGQKAWVSFDAEVMEGKMLSTPTINDVSVKIDSSVIIQYYSR